jgi:hypothetical protein
MNAASKPPKPADARLIDLKTEFVAGSIKSVIVWVDQVRQELVNTGVALKAGYITPQRALDRVEEIVPGCIGYIPPLSGLVVKNDGDVE